MSLLTVRPSTLFFVSWSSLLEWDCCIVVGYWWPVIVGVLQWPLFCLFSSQASMTCHVIFVSFQQWPSFLSCCSLSCGSILFWWIASSFLFPLLCTVFHTFSCFCFMSLSWVLVTCCMVFLHCLVIFVANCLVGLVLPGSSCAVFFHLHLHGLSSTMVIFIQCCQDGTF